MGGCRAAIEQNLKMTKWWGRKNIRKVSDFQKVGIAQPPLSPG